MNEQKMAEQLKKSGNLMDLTSDPEWLAEADDDDGWAEAGVATIPYANYLKSLTPKHHRSLRFQTQLVMILLPELRDWIETWGVGSSSDAVFAASKTILYRHLKQFMEEKKEWIEALVEEDSKHLPMEERSVRSQTISTLSQLFTSNDWEELATVASQEISQTVRQVQRTVLEDDFPATA